MLKVLDLNCYMCHLIVLKNLTYLTSLANCF